MVLKEPHETFRSRFKANLFRVENIYIRHQIVFKINLRFNDE